MNSSKKRSIKAPTGTRLRARSWLTEAPLRLIMNNLDPRVGERPDELVVYGGIGKAARNWACFDAIVEKLETLGKTRPSWCSPASLSAYSRRTRTRPGC